MGRVEHDLTDEQWCALRAAWGGCAYCGVTDTPLQRDCVLPVSRGGRYTLDNIVPACRSCNTSKCDAEVTGWLRRKDLDERIRREAERIGEGYDALRLRLGKSGGLQALETQMVREKSLDLITSIANIQGAE